MSSLTKFLHVSRERRQIAAQGGLKTPVLMSHPVPEGFETACISLRTGDFHTVRIKPQRPTRTGFYELDVDDEDRSFAALISYLYEFGEKREMGNVSEVPLVTDQEIEAVQSYFDTYDGEWRQGFVGLVGFAALITSELLELPEEVEDPSTLTEETLLKWMSKYLHVGRLKESGVPVFYNQHLGPDIVFSGDPKEVGILTRVGDYVSVMVHNAERSVIILRVGLLDDDIEPDSGGSTEAHTGPEGD